MIDKGFPSIKKSTNDKKYRVNQAIQSIKDAILKRKFNLAWDHAAKYYQQNKASLSNEQTYQLCWLSCESITKKINLRLTATPKSSIPVTQSHIQHLLSLYLSLHILIFPEVTNKDKEYFDMLRTSEQLINPKSISPHDLVFDRKPDSFFMQKDQIDKSLKKLVKQHLRITNNVLMFKVKTKRSSANVIQAANCAQQIFRSFNEYDFPVEMMNFQLIKLSIIEDLGIKQGFKCEYRLPIGLINKIYTHLRSNNEEAAQHYVKKLCSYLVLSFRNLTISIEDIFIICQEVLYMTKLMQEKWMPQSYQAFQLTKKLPFLRLNRQLTIEKDPIQESQMGRSNKSNISAGFSTSNKISQKKLQSKTKIYKPEGQLRSIALMALEKINTHLEGRKQVDQIILKYFTQAQFKRFQCDPLDQIIENEVFLKLSRKNKKNNEVQYNYQQNQGKCERRQNRSLTSILKKKCLQKKVSTFQQQQKEALAANPSKKNAKFIVKNIQQLKKQPETNPYIKKKLEKLCDQDFLSSISLIDESQSDEEGNVSRNFQKQRRIQLKLINDKHSIKHNEQAKLNKHQKTLRQIDESQTFASINDEQRLRSISLLDDVVDNQINQLLQLPLKQKGKLGSTSLHTATFNKLQSLKCQVQSLNLQRKLLVERLQKRSQTVSLSSLDQSFNQDKKMNEICQKDQLIYKVTQNLKAEVSKHIAINSKLMNLQKQNKFKLSMQPKIKLKLEKGIRKIPQLTFARLEQEYKKIENIAQDKKQAWDMVLSSQYDKLRRDVAKNQFASQNQKRSSKNTKCETVRQDLGEDDIM